ncbi:hypothetical protein EON81_02680 [bacterium]|nr:MAG: hypothetical protein EON81_02680 [bacterium]
MEHFGRWVAQNADKRVGSRGQWMALFSTLGAVFFPALSVGAYQDNMPFAMWITGALGVASLAGWIPYLKFLRENKGKNKYRSEFSRIWWLQSMGKLTDEMGQKGPMLEAAARDWESIGLLNDRHSDPDDLAAKVKSEADARMDRIFDLSVSPPAYYGLSQERADAQIQKDLQWLTQARKAMEDATLTGDALVALDEDPLLRLRSLAAERVNAMAELRA